MEQTKPPTPIADQVDDITAWYERQTGRKVAARQLGQVLAILLYLERTGRALDDCRIVVQSDPMWSSREKRTPPERQAEQVGRSTEPGTRRPQYFFIVGGAA